MGRGGGGGVDWAPPRISSVFSGSFLSSPSSLSSESFEARATFDRARRLALLLLPPPRTFKQAAETEGVVSAGDRRVARRPESDGDTCRCADFWGRAKAAHGERQATPSATAERMPKRMPIGWGGGRLLTTGSGAAFECDGILRSRGGVSDVVVVQVIFLVADNIFSRKL